MAASDLVPAPASAALETARTSPPRSAYPLFLAGMASWFLAWGSQQVVVQWLLVERLHESAARVGTAQMALLLPALVLLLPGGALADRVERSRALIVLHVLAALSCAALGLRLWAGALSFSLVVAYSLAMGAINAFVLPARDALLSDVIRRRVSRAVAGLTFVQHGGMVLGSLAGGLAGLLGAPALLAMQALVLLGGIGPLHRLPREPRSQGAAQPKLRAAELLDGAFEVARSPVLRPIMLLNLSVGLVFVGTYVVLLPLLARELYGGGADRIAGLAGAMPAGTLPGTLLIAARGGLARPGLALLLGQGFAGLCLCALALGLPYPGAVAAVVGWGLGGAFAINGSRTLYQEHASVANRGRVLAMYAFAIVGAGPFGALLAGLLADAFGTLATLALYGTCMTLGLLATAVFGNVHRFR